MAIMDWLHAAWTRCIIGNPSEDRVTIYIYRSVSLGEAPGHASVVHTFEAVAGTWGSVSAPAVSRVMGGAPNRNKNSKK